MYWCVRGINFACLFLLPVYKGQSREPENVPFMDSWPLYTC